MALNRPLWAFKCLSTAPLSAADPNNAALTTRLQVPAPPWLAVLHVKDMVFPLGEEGKTKICIYMGG